MLLSLWKPSQSVNIKTNQQDWQLWAIYNCFSRAQTCIPFRWNIATVTAYAKCSHTNALKSAEQVCFQPVDSVYCGGFISQEPTFCRDDLRCWQHAVSILTDQLELSVLLLWRTLPSWRALTLHRYDTENNHTVWAACFHRHNLTQTMSHQLMLEIWDRSKCRLFLQWILANISDLSI